MKVYNITIGGIDHTMQLTDEDAKRLGAVEVKQVGVVKNKARAADTKG